MKLLKLSRLTYTKINDKFGKKFMHLSTNNAYTENPYTETLVTYVASMRQLNTWCLWILRQGKRQLSADWSSSSWDTGLCQQCDTIWEVKTTIWPACKPRSISWPVSLTSQPRPVTVFCQWLFTDSRTKSQTGHFQLHLDFLYFFCWGPYSLWNMLFLCIFIANKTLHYWFVSTKITILSEPVLKYWQRQSQSLNMFCP